jgi:hypothetical protein
MRIETRLYFAIRNSKFFGGEGGIRTHGGLSPTPVFETGALIHYATSPKDDAEKGRRGDAVKKTFLGVAASPPHRVFFKSVWLEKTPASTLGIHLPVCRR